MASATFVSEQEAHVVVENWLNMLDISMYENFGENIRGIKFYQGEEYGNPGYYVVFLSPTGWVIVSADDRLEAIRAFGNTYLTPEEYENSVMKYLFRLDLPLMLTRNYLRSQNKLSEENSIENPRRWKKLQQLTPAHSLKKSFIAQASSSNDIVTFPSYFHSEDISNDIVVAPLLRNTWHQYGLVDSIPRITDRTFYNHFVSSGDIRYAVGCVPLATSQILRFMEFPTIAPAPPANGSKVIYDGIPIEEPIMRNTRGYNGPQKADKKPRGD
jgi:hypothetical protein